jgi:hypothetical protein
MGATLASHWFMGNLLIVNIRIDDFRGCEELGARPTPAGGCD